MDDNTVTPGRCTVRPSGIRAHEWAAACRRYQHGWMGGQGGAPEQYRACSNRRSTTRTTARLLQVRVTTREEAATVFSDCIPLQPSVRASTARRGEPGPAARRWQHEALWGTGGRLRPRAHAGDAWGRRRRTAGACRAVRMHAVHACVPAHWLGCWGRGGCTGGHGACHAAREEMRRSTGAHVGGRGAARRLLCIYSLWAVRSQAIIDGLDRVCAHVWPCVWAVRSQAIVDGLDRVCAHMWPCV